jgi:hypothetical protein
MDLKLIYSALLQALRVLFTLFGLAQDAATTKQLNDVQMVAVNAELALINLTYGLDAAYVQRVDILSRLTVLQAYVAAIPTAPQLAANPVILPTTPPTGYGGASSSSIATDVWDYQYPPASGNIMGAQMDRAGWAAYALGTVSAEKYPYTDYIRYHFNYSDNINGPSTIPGPQLDPTTILPTDANVVAWLNRTDYQGFHWSYLGKLPVSYNHITTADEWWICDISDLAFSALKAGAPLPSLGAPVWPGLAKVTLGTPVTITTAFTIAVPLHGVIVTLTAEPSKASFFSFDGINSYRNLGQLSFTSDDGQQEHSQPLGFTSEIYTPRVLAKAAGVKVYTVGGVAGTVTPWVIA